MPLATPSSVTLSRVQYEAETSRDFVTLRMPRYSTQETPPELKAYSKLLLRGNIQWSNTEAAPHLVKLTIAGRAYWLPQGSTLIREALLATLVPPASQPCTITVTVQLVAPADSSAEVSQTFNINWMTPATLTGDLSFAAGVITLPNWSGAAHSEAPAGPNEKIGAFGVSLAAGETTETRRPERLDLLDTAMQPARNVAGAVHRYVYRVKTAEIIVASPQDLRASLTTQNSQLAGWTKLYVATTPGALEQTLYYEAVAASAPFAAESITHRAVKGRAMRVPLVSSQPAYWTITSGAPAGMVIETDPRHPDAVDGQAPQAYLSGTPTATGVSTIVLAANRALEVDTAAAPVTATANVTLTVLADAAAAENRTKIVANPGWLNNGLSYRTGDVVSLSLASDPPGAVWQATGLPAGLVLDAATGTISGVAEAAGRFIAHLTARAEGLEVSAPVAITITVREGAAGVGGGTGAGGSGEPARPEQNAGRRVPWIYDRWRLTDLQIHARTRKVESTLMPGDQALALKVGDAWNFAVFFINSENTPFDLAPDKLRLSIRPAANVEEALVFSSQSTPAAVTTEPDPYYLITVASGPAQRSRVEEWAEQAGKDAPLACVADLDWVKDGQQFSAQTFPVALVLDVTRP